MSLMRPRPVLAVVLAPCAALVGVGCADRPAPVYTEGHPTYAGSELEASVWRGPDEVVDEETDAEDEETPVARPPVSRAEYVVWRDVRYGTSNPERMTNPVWVWIVQSGASAWEASNAVGDPRLDLGPPARWCFERFGRTRTALPDGRVVYVGGEHEDFYDPDFHIYNDVVVRHPDGGVEIYGYPRDVFPPTEDHSATLVGDRLVLIGNHDAPAAQAHTTQVFVLDLNTWAMQRILPVGEAPGAISDVVAAPDPGSASVTLRGGQVVPAASKRAVSNLDAWRLHLSDWRWERLTTTRATQLWISHEDPRDRLHAIEHMRSTAAIESVWGRGPRVTTALSGLLDALGPSPMLAPESFDRDLASRLFHPSRTHVLLREDPRSAKITVDGVAIEFTVELDHLEVIVHEGLDASTRAGIVDELLARLATLDHTTWVVEP